LVPGRGTASVFQQKAVSAADRSHVSSSRWWRGVGSAFLNHRWPSNQLASSTGSLLRTEPCGSRHPYRPVRKRPGGNSPPTCPSLALSLSFSFYSSLDYSSLFLLRQHRPLCVVRRIIVRWLWLIVYLCLVISVSWCRLFFARCFAHGLTVPSRAEG